jgi:hypothetical protein
MSKYHGRPQGSYKEIYANLTKISLTVKVFLLSSWTLTSRNDSSGNGIADLASVFIREAKEEKGFKIIGKQIPFYP